MANPVQFNAKNGKPASGFLTEPTGSGKAPGLVLLQEMMGINDHIKALVDRFAGEGFLVVAPDLFHGKVATNRDDGFQMMFAVDKPQAVQEIAGAADYLRSHARCNGKVGAIGFCFGGGMVFATVANVPDAFDAATPFYGLPGPGVDYSRVKTPIQAHWGKDDPVMALNLVEEIKEKVTAAGGKMELFVYEGCGHAFVNDTRPDAHNADAAKTATTRAVEFLKKNLA